MTVTINGEQLHTFDPVPRGRVGCTVPGRYISGLESVAMVLEHPKAAVPRAITGVTDDRRLAIAFHSLSLRGH